MKTSTCLRMCGYTPFCFFRSQGICNVLENKKERICCLLPLRAVCVQCCLTAGEFDEFMKYQNASAERSATQTVLLVCTYVCMSLLWSVVVADGGDKLQRNGERMRPNEQIQAHKNTHVCMCVKAPQRSNSVALPCSCAPRCCSCCC